MPDMVDVGLKPLFLEQREHFRESTYHNRKCKNQISHFHSKRGLFQNNLKEGQLLLLVHELVTANK